MKLLYPGHNYLGPGNSINNGEPVDKADEIAREHDIKYNFSKSEQDIQDADYDAIDEFFQSTFNQGHLDLPSAAGAIGLGLKKSAEFFSNSTLYPLKYNPAIKAVNSVSEFLSGDELIKSTPEELMPGSKRPRTEPDSTGAEVGTDGTNMNPQAGSSLPGGTGADVSATIIRNPHIKTIKWCFNKTFQMYSGGFQFSQYEPNAFFQQGIFASLFKPNSKLTTTPLATLDPGSNWLYMSPSEFAQLPLFSYAKTCGIKVTPLGYRLPFQTNEASAGYANSQTLVQCCYTVGLNNIMNVSLTNYAIDPTNPTKVQETVAEEPNYEAIMYGNTNNIGAVLGVPVHFNQYTVILQNRNPDAGDITEKPMLTNHMSIRNVNDCKGVPIINYKHEFKNGMLKWAIGNSQRQVLETRTAANPGLGHIDLPEGFNHTRSNHFTSAVSQLPATGGQLQEEEYDDFTGYQNTGALAYKYTIEKSYWMQNQVAQHQTPDYTPLVHFGCMPVPSNFALAPAESYASAVIQWQVETMLEVEVNINSLDSYAQVPYNKAWDPIFTLRGVPKNNGRVILINNRRANIVSTPPSTVRKINTNRMQL